MSHSPPSKAALSYLGPYRLLNLIHKGQGSDLWQAYDDGKQRMVGIKAVSEKHLKNREHVSYLRQEYKVGLKAVHPRIIEVFAFDIDRGIPYLAMEWFSAPNMKQRIRLGTDPIAHVMAQVVEEAAEGLAHLNKLGWVHRDVKPDNFLISDQGEVKLIDLGLAIRARRGLAKWLSLRSRIQGTRSYISPEQLRGGAVDQRADVYSFGCTIHELLAGKPPFTGNNAQELLMKQLKSPPPPLEAANSNITPEFAQLVRRCLAKDPGARFQSLDEFLEGFRACRVFKITPRPPGGPTP